MVVHLKTRGAGFSTMKVLSVIFVNKHLIQNLISYNIEEFPEMVKTCKTDECIYKSGWSFRYVNEGTQINDEEKLKMKIKRS